ncbi:MAG: hypothetical protein GXY83_34730 [Rhodopirellula sp.]|nr:hypothetical protein [Rhodopirellula sp.]
MASRKELVDKAIRFGRPDRVPIVFWNCDQADGDLMLYHLSLGDEPREDSSLNAWDWSVNEWGYKLESMNDGTMGHPVRPYYPDLPRPGEIRIPPIREDERMAAVPGFLETCGDRYRLASLDLSGFTVYTLLRGFENSMEDVLLAAEGFSALLDAILQFECELMRLAARHGFHGIHLADDWGTQSGLMVSPALWRRVFKPRYRRQFALAHDLGLDVWYHCCGNLTEIAADFHEIGVDVLNISQPNVVDVAEVGRRLRGKQCFMVPISYQTVSLQGTREEIFAEARRLHRCLATDAGGLIGYVEEYGCMGMSQENYRSCGEAFRQLKATGCEG